MAQGILERRRVPPETLNPAARPAVDALRAWRYQAWMRARMLAFRRSIINPVIAFWAWLTLSLHPAGYKLWCAACVVKTAFAVTAESASIGLTSVAGRIKQNAQSVHFNGIRRLQASLVLIGLSTVVFTYGFYGMGLEVFVDGESMGFIYSQSQFERAVANVSSHAEDILQRPFTVEPNATFRYSLVSRSKLFNSAEVENLLFARIPELKTLDVLSINGETIAGVEQKGALREHLNFMLNNAAEESGGSSSFVEKVSISRQLAPASIEVPVSDIGNLLNSNILPAFYASSDSGSTVSEVAGRYGMTADVLLSMNPHVSADSSIENQALLVSYETPLLQVQITRTEVYTETVPYETKYVDDPKMYTGKTNVVTEGVDGYNTVTANVGYVNGREYSRNVVGVENTLEPVAEVIAQGTLVPPTFIRPFYGRMSSSYGMRDLFNKNRMHSGVDFAGPTGSPVVASCGGKITFSGWKSGYGNCVIIDHGNGLSTLYGHNSKNVVKAGDKVKQGDLIARVGNTGNSTGPHVHFEVHVNGKAVNPWNYIK